MVSKTTLSLKDFQTHCETEKSKVVIGYFSGAEDENGVSYCGDCNDAKPSFKKLVEEFSEKTDIHYFSIDRDTWKNKENEYRTSPFFKLTNIPTIVVYKDGMELGRKKEGEINDYEKLSAFVKDSFDI